MQHAEGSLPAPFLLLRCDALAAGREDMDRSLYTLYTVHYQNSLNAKLSQYCLNKQINISTAFIRATR
eukprot:1136498-Pelagomonas_calceolata.AAC.2